MTNKKSKPQTSGLKPLSPRTLALIEKEAIGNDPENKRKDWQVFFLLRYTGMHPCVITDSKYQLKEEMIGTDMYVTWYRPKKKGMEAFTSILKSEKMDFDINEYVTLIQKRRKGRRSRMYIYRLVKKRSLDAGFTDVSPKSYRHTAGVEMLRAGILPSTVAQTLNCSEKTLKAYIKLTPEMRGDEFKRAGW